jgi:hypothetical protein
MGLTTKVVLSAAAVLLLGCDADRLSTDDPVWHLSVRDGAAPSRYVATFDMEPGGNNMKNHSRCADVRAQLQAGRNDVQYRCAVGRFRAH